MKLKKLLRTLAITSAAVLLPLTGQAQDKVRIATEGAWAPFNYVDESGALVGFDVDIANALCAKMNTSCEIVVQDWDGMIPALNVRKFDAIVSSMSITDDRLKIVDFTDKYYSGGLRFMGPKKSEITPTKQGLQGKTIGAQRSTIAGMHLEDNYADVAEIKLYDTQEAVYLDLAAGRLDAALSDELPTYDWLKSDKGTAFEFKGEAFAKNDIIGIAIRKNDPLKEKLNKALTEIIADGTYAEINAKYFPFPIY
ncbi:transporter substrate-binding domain-containing protein [Parendozoicomonas haliclonae]|uniref:Lysine-arginine-ornithine-binding periplasmic protein n=1 Tax=Parendozoicomonas haliclonae TaxID=1960125 RepID=A0A1X7AGS5_9GAMM|nr:transporter substrate-binding domain-containing protein [Parendozoicomonas haliclonae]SMA40378.1 Lysine-arginine-ornithine-binding periplasmic protein precursor [Parendozoicomonas haliclonae]